jgi:hypothetical protein
MSSRDCWSRETDGEAAPFLQPVPPCGKVHTSASRNDVGAAMGIRSKQKGRSTTCRENSSSRSLRIRCPHHQRSPLSAWGFLHARSDAVGHTEDDFVSRTNVHARRSPLFMQHSASTRRDFLPGGCSDLRHSVFVGERSQFARTIALPISRAVLRWTEAPPLGDPRRHGENGWMPGKTSTVRA